MRVHPEFFNFSSAKTAMHWWYRYSSIKSLTVSFASIIQYELSNPNTLGQGNVHIYNLGLTLTKMFT